MSSGVDSGAGRCPRPAERCAHTRVQPVMGPAAASQPDNVPLTFPAHPGGLPAADFSA